MTAAEKAEYRQAVRNAIVAGVITQPIPPKRLGRHPTVKLCECGNPATETAEAHGWQCARCKRLNSMVWHQETHERKPQPDDEEAWSVWRENNPDLFAPAVPFNPTRIRNAPSTRPNPVPAVAGCDVPVASDGE